MEVVEPLFTIKKINWTQMVYVLLQNKNLFAQKGNRELTRFLAKKPQNVTF